MRLLVLCLLPVALGASLACRSAPTETVPAATVSTARGGGPEPSPPPPASVAATTTPLVAARPLVDLPVPRRAAAVVALPLGATSKRPVLVAAHGLDDLVEPLCETFQSIVRARAFVLCPRGQPSTVRPGAWTYLDQATLADEIEAAVQALRERFPDHVDDGPLVFVGFSLGSFHGVDVVTRAPEHTPRVVLIEGGHDPWNGDRVARFAERGGRRVLFVTGQAINEERSRRAASELSQAGVPARVVHVEGAGHVYTGAVRDRMAEAFDWVVEGDERWSR